MLSQKFPGYPKEHPSQWLKDRHPESFPSLICRVKHHISGLHCLIAMLQPHTRKRWQPCVVQRVWAGSLHSSSEQQFCSSHGSYHTPQVTHVGEMLMNTEQRSVLDASCVFTSALCNVLLIHPAWKVYVNFTSNLLAQIVLTHLPNTKKTQLMSNSSLDNSMILLIYDNPHEREQSLKLKEMVFLFSFTGQK